MSGIVPYVSQSVGMTAADTQQVGTEATVAAAATNLTDSAGVTRVAASTAGAAVTGILTVGSGSTGLTARNWVGGAKVAIYSTAVAAAAGNYALNTNSVTTYVNGTTTAGFAINDTPILSVNAAGTTLTGVATQTSHTFRNYMLSGTAGTPTVEPIIAYGITIASGSGMYGINSYSSNVAAGLAFKIMTAAAVQVTALTLDAIGAAVVGSVSATTTVRTGGYTVATLPVGVAGDRAYVTDATAPAYGAALTGGGAVVVPVFKNATIWVVG